VTKRKIYQISEAAASLKAHLRKWYRCVLGEQ